MRRKRNREMNHYPNIPRKLRVRLQRLSDENLLKELEGVDKLAAEEEIHRRLRDDTTHKKLMQWFRDYASRSRMKKNA